jgi:hypothetical protein
MGDKSTGLGDPRVARRDAENCQAGAFSLGIGQGVISYRSLGDLPGTRALEGHHPVSMQAESDTYTSRLFNWHRSYDDGLWLDDRTTHDIEVIRKLQPSAKINKRTKSVNESHIANRNETLNYIMSTSHD